MSRYEGLDLVGLMDLLHEIVEPAPVDWLPQTTGWWIAGAWVVAVLLLVARHGLAGRRRNRYRREAERELDAISVRAAAEPAATARDIATLVKRTALAAYPRDQVASLTGAQWAAFLCTSANDDTVVAAAATRIAAAPYQPDADGEALLAPARRWIRLHRA